MFSKEYQHLKKRYKHLNRLIEEKNEQIKAAREEIEKRIGKCPVDCEFCPALSLCEYWGDECHERATLIEARNEVLQKMREERKKALDEKRKV